MVGPERLRDSYPKPRDPALRQVFATAHKADSSAPRRRTAREDTIESSANSYGHAIVRATMRAQRAEEKRRAKLAEVSDDSDDSDDTDDESVSSKPPTPAYERQRAANIARNAQVLADLGLQ